MDKVSQQKIRLNPVKMPPSHIVNVVKTLPHQINALPQNTSNVPPHQRLDYLHQLGVGMKETEQAINTAEPMLSKMEEAEKSNPATPMSVTPEQNQAKAAEAYFDIIKEAQVPPSIPTNSNEGMAFGDPSSMNAPMDGTGPASAIPETGIPQKFNGFQSLRQFLDSSEDAVAVSQEFRKRIGNDISKKDSTSNQEIDPQHTISDMVVSYIENKSTMGNDDMDARAKEIYDLLPDNMKEDSQPGVGAGQVLTHNETVASIVNNTNATIKKIAENLANKKISSSSFNMKKFAQHKTLDQAIMFGPGQTRVDPFSGQLISNWHLVERNKGFGLKIDDILDIDWESIWRSTIMDKYSQPYRNKDGEWVGGYLNKRFEVNRNVPEGNNLQLKPGQLRRPYLPEYGVLEGRLESMREKSAEDRGYKPVSEGKPFNWKEASNKKKVK